jgi:hypothetical protein
MTRFTCGLLLVKHCPSFSVLAASLLDQHCLCVGLQADPRTAEWLEAEAALLRGHKRRLEEALSAFAPIVRGCGLECDSCGGQGHGHSGGGGCAPTHAHAGPGGAVNLRRLRDDIALLAGRLRQVRVRRALG